MKVLKQVIEQWGFIDKIQLAEIAEHFPRMQVVIKWGGMERERALAYTVAERIKEVEDSNIDYVREVFLDSESFNQLKSVLLGDSA